MGGSARATPLFASAAEVDLAAVGKGRFGVETEVGTLECYTALIDSPRLVVMLNGAVDRTTDEVVFARWNWAPLLDASVLCVYDPTIYLSPTLRIGWYVGTRELDATAIVAELVAAAASRAGFADEHVCFYGSSGGGFASLTVAARMAKPRAIAINPQIQLARHYEGQLAAFLAVYAPGERIDPEAEPRLSAVAAMRRAVDDGRDCRVGIVQNTDDHFHVAQHFSLFAEEFGIPLDGGQNASGSMASLLYSDVRGHGAIPPDAVNKIHADLLPFVFGDAGPPDGTI